MKRLHQVALALYCIAVCAYQYLYVYPVWHGCAFPSKDASSSSFDRPASTWGKLRRHLGGGGGNTAPAPFRLLVLADPQLEGDSSITTHAAGPSLRSTCDDALRAGLDSTLPLAQRLGRVARALQVLLAQGPGGRLRAWRKRVDLVGNDFYLAHIYRFMCVYTRPTHVAVLGDLVGSQWIGDDEFGRRASRFWTRVFRHGLRVDDAVTAARSVEELGRDPSWERRVIAVAGNHDVGYAGDMTEERVERFEAAFGRANWEIAFEAPRRDGGLVRPATLRLVVFNSMNLDVPAGSQALQDRTYRFLNDVIEHSAPVEDRAVGTVLLTHIPLHKEAGVCADPPFFDYFRDGGGGIKEQNHLSYDASRNLLEGVFGMSGDARAPGGGRGRKGIILTGHDHEGCDVYHHLPPAADAGARRWNATGWQDAAGLVGQPVPGIREVTLRSMMGEFGGNAGMLSAWFDEGAGEWRFELGTCALGVQHVWWAVHGLFLVTVLFLAAVGLLALLDSLRTDDGKPPAGDAAATTRDEGTVGGGTPAGGVRSASGIEPADGLVKRRRP